MGQNVEGRIEGGAVPYKVRFPHAELRAKREYILQCE